MGLPTRWEPNVYAEFATFFFDMLLEIQKDRSDLIHADVDVLEDFGLARSARRGATTRAQVAKVLKEVID
jgi:hypothetical protein